ncbi:YARHG domain-containing protein [Xiamenia xianingshaonis]|uniref:YARHG domain-containing protein n=1 Tax=Xiamenia xianingshaonis TaxID=2682776 RepID=A0A9E6SUV5_9ACTN|nr:YARHG domain-containing protein [Xiamenia xianingshaonis]NHM14419.1 YARHG domain-containing protein [Xiamenia xianingshaonis]QTU84893.1 YARHG domain-containing protein [Xiamenia xianingshaonis]
MAATAAAVDPERRASAMRADGTPCLFCGSIIPDGKDECPHCHRSRSGRAVAASGGAAGAAARRGRGAGAQRDHASRKHDDDEPKSRRDAGSTSAFTAVLGGAAAGVSNAAAAEPEADEAQAPNGAEDRKAEGSKAEDRKAEVTAGVSAAAAAAAAAMAERQRGGAARGGDSAKRQPTRAKQPLSTPGRQKAEARSVVVGGLSYEEQRKKRLAALAGVAVVAAVGIGIIAGSAFLGSGATGEEQTDNPTEATQPSQAEGDASTAGKDKSVTSGGTGAKGAESASGASGDSKDAADNEAADDAAATGEAAEGTGGAEGFAGAAAGAAGASGAASIWPADVASAPVYAYDLPYYGGVGGSQGIPNASFGGMSSFGGGSSSGGTGAGTVGGALGVLQAETEQALAQAVARVEDYYLPDAQKRTYSRQELEQLSDFELYLARNEIYARHGRLFSVDVLIDYFNSRKWYDGKYTAEAFNALENVFNEFEVENIELVKEVERERASAYLRE